VRYTFVRLRGLAQPFSRGRPLSKPDLTHAATAAEFEAALRRHVLDVWFPRSVDVEHGGFLCDFDRAWKPCGSHEKMLEFQARQTFLAAEACEAYPGEERFRQAALHGFRYLRDAMWDRDSGGWFLRLERDGRPLDASTKHAHGMAYATEACVAVHEATGEPGALDLACECFEWLERGAHDSRYGGYVGFLKRDGAPIRDPSECPRPATIDHIGTPIGLKDANVHTDLLRMLVHLYRVRPTATLADRIGEISVILSERMATPSGALHCFCQADWTPVPRIVRYGYQFQAAHRLLAAGGLTGNPQGTARMAYRLVDNALQHSWDRAVGGFRYAASEALPPALEGYSVSWFAKQWWVQAEALKTLLLVSRLEPANADYRGHFEAQWAYIRRHIIDERHGGTYSMGLDILPAWRRRLGARLAPASATRKGSVWKDGSHEGLALLFCLRALRGDDQASHAG
jgi:cellobiose epimerase